MTTRDNLPIDENQRNIFRHNLGSSLTAEAGAGTGKTSLLVDRLIGLATYHGDSLKHIVAITYTEKAADELFDRVRKELEIKLSACTTTSDLKKYSDILAEIETANISTIHGLASSIVHDRAIQAGIDPEFAHIDPNDENMMVRDAIFASLNSSDEQRDKWLSQYIILGGKMSGLMDLCYAMFDKRHILNESKLKTSVHNRHELVSDIMDAVKKSFEVAKRCCLDQSDIGFKNIESANNAIPQNFDGTFDLIYKWLSMVAALRKNAGNQKNWDSNDNLKSFKKDVISLKEQAENVLLMLRRDAIENLLIWIKDILLDVQDSKISQGKIGFADQLSLARHLLKSVDTREEFANRYQRLLIDEFQDTDPVQVEIALYLSAVKSADTDAYDLQLEPGKLSVVGDPKQSIYRFRGADIETYKNASKLIVKTGKSIQISQNFRSSKGIIDFVNAFFSSLWSTVDSTGFLYTPIAHDPKRPQPSPNHCVTVLLPNDDVGNETLKVDDLRLAEARNIASTIKQSIIKQDWTICDPHSKKLRAVKYGDFALLFPSTTKIDIYTKVFDQEEIPFQIEGGKKFFLSPIATEFHSCMSAINNPADRLSVIAALRSRFFTVSDQDIFMWQKICHGIMDYRSKIDGTVDSIKPALEILAKLHSCRNDMPADQLINRFLNETKVISQLLSIQNSWSDIAAIERFQEHAYSWSRDNGTGLSGFCRYFSNLIDSGDDKGSGGSTRSRNAVKMMTIHAAKGLEFPVVALANFFGGYPKKTSIIAEYKERNFEVRIGSQSNGYFESADYSKLLGDFEQAEIEESLRLMYVAMTRARDHLIIPKFIARKKDGSIIGLFHEWFDDFLTDENKLLADGVTLWNSVNIPDDTPSINNTETPSINTVEVDTMIALKELNQWQADRDQRMKKAIKRLPIRISPSKMVTDKEVDYSSIVAYPIEYSGTLSIGNAFHNYMAKCSLSDHIDSELASLCALEHNIDIAQLSSLLVNCLSSTLWKKMIQSKQNWRELPVSARIDGIRIQGIIDAVYEDRNGQFHIIDYKTGVSNPQVYHPQLYLYADSLRVSIGQNVASARLYYAQSGEIDSVPLPNHD